MESEYTVKILEIEDLNHNIKKFIIEKPENYDFEPGQYTLISINSLDNPELKSKKKPFTFSSIPDDEFLELIIKRYDGPGAVTPEFHKLKPGDELIIEEPKGTLEFKGKGIFFAGGTGMVPFISMLKSLNKQDPSKVKENIFIHSNQKHQDVFLENELKEILGKNFIPVLTREEKKGYDCRRIDAEFLSEFINDETKFFYFCGPKEFVLELSDVLEKHNIKPENIIHEGR